MKFVITKAGNWRGDEVIDLPGVSWERLLQEDKRYITEEEAKKWSWFPEFLEYHKGLYRIEEGTNYIIGTGHVEIVEVLEVATLEELMLRIGEAGYPFILSPKDSYPYPEILIYADYIE
jgi:hypothetical protein